MTEADLDRLPFRAAQTMHDVPHDGYGGIADLVGAFDAGAVDRVAEQRGGVSDLEEGGRPAIVQVDVADHFIECRDDIRRVPHQKTRGAERRGVAALPDQESEMGATGGPPAGLDDLSHEFIRNGVFGIAKIVFGDPERFQQRAGRHAEFTQQIRQDGDRCDTDFAFLGQEEVGFFAASHVRSPVFD